MSQTIRELAEIAGEPEEVQQLLVEADFSPVFEKAIADLEQDHAGFFQNQSTPEGEPWQPLAASTVKRKGHNVILIETDELEESLAGRNQSSIREIIEEGYLRGFSYGTSRAHAHRHQEGEGVPQRRFLGFTEERIRQIENDVFEHVTAVLTGETV